MLGRGPFSKLCGLEESVLDKIGIFQGPTSQRILVLGSLPDRMT